MDEEWSIIKDDCLMSSTAVNQDVAVLFCEDAFGDLRRVKTEPDETSDYHGSTSVSPSSSLSSPSDMKDETALGLDLNFCMPNFHGSNHLSPIDSLNFDLIHQHPQHSPLPPVSQFSQQNIYVQQQQNHVQQVNNQNRGPVKSVHHMYQHGDFSAGRMQKNSFYNEGSLSPPLSGTSSPFETNLVEQTLARIIYPGSLNSISSDLGLTTAQQQLKTRSKMHEMAVKQRLITDQDPRGQGTFTLSAEERRTLQQEGLEIPTKLPLTKKQEEDLKVVRRKIKNKLSAQESRRKRKEYMDALEMSSKTYADDNSYLTGRVKQLEQENHQLRLRLSAYEDINSEQPMTKRQKIEPDF